MKTKIAVYAYLLLSVPAVFAASVNIGWMALSRPWSAKLMERYVALPHPNPMQVTVDSNPHPELQTPTAVGPRGLSKKDARQNGETFRFLKIPANTATHVTILNLPLAPDPKNPGPNPFMVDREDFNVGGYLPWPLLAPPQVTPVGEIPKPTARDIEWFDEQANLGHQPDIFVAAGHHLISQGFHNPQQNGFFYEPAIIASARANPGVRAYFDHVKIAILFGCNTMSNLEPHHDDGSVMTPQEIYALYAAGDRVSKHKLVGDAHEFNTLEFYKNHLLVDYGIQTGPDYSYTRNPKAEVCGKNHTAPYNCDIANVDRVFPEQGLFDGSHRFNQPLRMSELFRNAYLVLGYSTVSPSEESRVKMLQNAVELASQTLKLGHDNVVRIIMDESTSEFDRKRAIVALREAWERTTLRYLGRPSGSITPYYPDIDGGYVVDLHLTKDAQLNAKYR